MTLAAVAAVAVVVGLLLAGAGALTLRRVGARPRLARRLAGPREVPVGRLLSTDARPERPVRVAGRIRCRDPLEMGGGERLVAYHRDIEVRAGGRWRTIERLRETRSFDLWDHDGSLTVDPADAAEPLVTIPQVWRGDADELQEPHRTAARRLAEREGPLSGARATTRTVNVTDRLLVLARVPTGGRARLEPPEGGFVISTLALPDAMRLLAGRSRRAAALAVIGLGAGVAVAGIGLVVLLGTIVAGA